MTLSIVVFWSALAVASSSSGSGPADRGRIVVYYPSWVWVMGT